MSLLNKSDLNYKYTWSSIPSDSPKVSGLLDKTRFSRREGYEVLYLINYLCNQWEMKKVNSATRMEKMVNDSLPSNIQSQEGVKEWIQANWNP
jgi:hypothetical protein